MPSLSVPYFVQPTPITCQSTCLKMVASYLEQRFGVCTGAGEMDIEDIWREVNESPQRPSKPRNAHDNFAWWLNKYFGAYGIRARRESGIPSESRAQALIKRSIDDGWPVLVGVSHERVKGHIIVVLGYSGMADMRSGGQDFLCHDPYGRFHREHGSKEYGKRRFDRGASLFSGGQTGPGDSIWQSLGALSREARFSWDLVLLR
ncbi:MAG TPA: C39 family peptidase [Burkholderiaceae bacterium]|nr:C39 family peptidase [Burkholderiaceae bacterium]